SLLCIPVPPPPPRSTLFPYTTLFRSLRRGPGPGRAGICRPGLQGRSRVRPPGDDGNPVRPLAGVQAGGDRALLRAPPAGSRDGEGQPTEADCRRHRLEIPQRAEEGAERMIRAVRDLSALEVVHPRVAMALRAKSGSERLRLAKRLL